MDRMVFAESWESYFADRNLRRFDDLYRYPETVTVNRNRKRDVLKLTLGEGPETNVASPPHGTGAQHEWIETRSSNNRHRELQDFGMHPLVSAEHS